MRQAAGGAAFVLPAVLLAALLAGCKKEDHYLAFSHHLHVTENAMACSDCHREMAAGRFAAAGHDACKECHEDWIKTKKVGPETCGKCHKAKDLKTLAGKEPVQPARAKDGVFRHTGALAKRCADCHGALLDKKLDRVPELTRGEKVRIREQAHGWGMDCATCHADMDPLTPPASHGANWTSRHGALGSQPDNACGVCHTEKSCRECHEVTMPASHNNLWRLKTHGVQAAWDRQRCLVCHEQDSCDACHASTRPSSHGAGWKQNHCLNCHPNRDAGTGCALCHEADLEAHPSPHAAGWRDRHCNSCHPGTPEGRQCGVCHAGGGDMAGHPNPHAAGWRDRHCNSCHPGTPEGRQCGVCHAGGGDMAGHPNPHAAGWRDRHCNSCHPGTPEGRQCGICHAGVRNMSEHPSPHSAGWERRHCFACHEGSPSADQCAVCHEGGNNTRVHRDLWSGELSFHNRFTGHCYECHEP